MPDLVPDFAYVHWREQYELPLIERAYDKAASLTNTFQDIGAGALAGC